MTFITHPDITKRAYNLWAAAGYPDTGAFAYYERARHELAQLALTERKLRPLPTA